jgi:hypothetical protein
MQLKTAIGQRREFSTPRLSNEQEEGNGNKDCNSWSASWLWDKFIICLVFALAGSSVVFLVRPFIKNVLKIEGSLVSGPNSFRVLYILLVTPIYSTVLITTGTIFGRRAFFMNVVKRMWGRILPQSIVDKLR